MGAFARYEIEPPPWLCHLFARTSLMQRLYRRQAADVAAILPPGGRLLDVGTGPGFLLEFLSPRRPDARLVGLDLSGGMLRRTRARLHRRLGHPVPPLLAADAQTLACRAASFDLVVASFSLHIWDDPARGVQEMLRVLKPGGRLLIFEMNRDCPPAAQRAYARQEGLPPFFVAAGFRLLSFHHALRARDFAWVCDQAALPRGRLDPVHHLFWRLTLTAPPPP